jgi:hypothetical protein
MTSEMFGLRGPGQPASMLHMIGSSPGHYPPHATEHDRLLWLGATRTLTHTDSTDFAPMRSLVALGVAHSATNVADFHPQTQPELVDSGTVSPFYYLA